MIILYTLALLLNTFAAVLQGMGMVSAPTLIGAVLMVGNVICAVWMGMLINGKIKGH